MAKKGTEKEKLIKKDSQLLKYIMQEEENKKEEHKGETQEQKIARLEAELERAKRKETKSRRVQLTLEPSIYEKLKAYAKKYDLSINEAIHKLIIEATLDL